ncbi:glucokinase [Ameyamaea chiangmaiensis NBRC 103196]|uniref:Glucokinase n=2 Tax=Ameyamaea chiangmaiensis TaxID=442969 RepID=A0A850P343_9PROT|nr:glucokinase [Ameyamaea chiangmaiensis]NVN39087.1 glucokinase [Ameyamaea chiangmaiensis]GBQ68949.1 glucokinase [Ameyamaea chiangmaiensis NBRC 103196]
MREIVAVDIGGTHARFAIATVADGRVAELGEATTLKCAEHASLALAWEAFAHNSGRSLPDAAAIAVACPIQGDILKLTNNPWVIQRSNLNERLGISHSVLVNDFGAVGHAVAQVEDRYLRHLCGPNVPLPTSGVTTIVGPGTGLGAACLMRRDERYFVMETEGGHIDFAPVDGLEDLILARLRMRYRRVSVERVVSGPGLVNLYEAIAEIENATVKTRDDKALWSMALDGGDVMAAAALERFCLGLGSFAGDLALAHGANSVVIAGGLGLRLADHLPRSGFQERFVAKGRFESIMARTPVKLITHPQPGLFGAAAAFAAQHT